MTGFRGRRALGAAASEQSDDSCLDGPEKIRANLLSHTP